MNNIRVMLFAFWILLRENRRMAGRPPKPLEGRAKAFLVKNKGTLSRLFKSGSAEVLLFSTQAAKEAAEDSHTAREGRYDGLLFGHVAQDA